MSKSPESSESQESFNENKNTLLELAKLLQQIKQDIGPGVNFEAVVKGEDLGELTEKVTNLSDDNKELLNKIGIKLELRKGHSNDDLGTSDIERSFDITVDIFDRDKFIKFLSGITVEDISENDREILAELGYCFDFQLTDYYNVDKGEDEFLTLSSSLKDIADQYSRLSGNNERLASYAEIFSNHSEAISGKFFNEWLQLRIFEEQMPINFFNPKYENLEKMLEKSQPSTFQKKWEEALDWVKKCSENKNAHAFLNNFLTKVQSHLTQAKQELRVNPNKSRQPDKIDDYFIAIDEVYSQIGEIIKQVS